MCGEQRMAQSITTGHIGSSPRVRGTASANYVQLKGDGIIPACAGNRDGVSSKAFRSWDHPRVCGEQYLLYQVIDTPKGSSPRMRGTVMSFTPDIICTRIIPAYAGNSGLLIPLIAASWDHPRVCGEQCVIKMSKYVNEGSSPRMRGTGHTS